MRVTVIHNPTAGDESVTPDQLLALLREAGHEPAYQSAKEDGWEAALRKPAELIVATGGDGTIRKVAMALPERAPPIAALPLGTANNVASSLGISGSAPELIAQWPDWRPRRFMLGLARGPWGERAFMESAGLGLLSTAFQYPRSPNWKPGLREVWTRWSGLLAEAKPIAVEIEVDGRDCSGSYLLAQAMNTRSAGPALELAPAASMQGELHLALATAAHRSDLQRYYRALLDGVPADPPSLRVEPGRVIRMSWSGARLSLDDEVWPDRDEPMPAETVNASLGTTDVGIAFLAPP